MQVLALESNETLTTLRSINFDIVTIRVDDPLVEIPVYKELLCSVSPYFRGAFDHSFLEAKERTISLPDVSEKTFRVFLQWVYTQACVEEGTQGGGFTKLVPPGYDDARKDDATIMEHEIFGRRTIFDEYHVDNQPDPKFKGLLRQHFHYNKAWIAEHNKILMAFLRLYVFADKYLVNQLQDDIMSALQGRALSLDWWPDPVADIVDTAYDNLPVSSPFKRFLVQPWAYWLDPTDISAVELHAMRDLHPGFLFDAMLFQSQRASNWACRKRDLFLEAGKMMPNSCIWHDHTVLSKEDCRKRLAKNVHIFTGLFDACTLS
jgi:hypothetical protein